MQQRFVAARNSVPGASAVQTQRADAPAKSSDLNSYGAGLSPAGDAASSSGRGVAIPEHYRVVPVKQQAREIRQKIAKEFLGQGLLYLEAGEPVRRNGYDVDHNFRPHSDFVYATGGVGCRPGFAALIDSSTGSLTLLAPKLPDEMSYWVGPQPSLEQLAEEAGADRCVYKDDLPALLASAASAAAGTPLELHTHAHTAEALRAAAGSVGSGSASSVRVQSDLLPSTFARCRAIKTDAEVGCLLLANQVSGEGHRDMWRAARPGLREVHLAAVFEATTRCGGLPALGYPVIVGAGPNSAVMHYAAGQAVLQPDQLVLVDAGAEYRYYTADITRCFPAAGQWTPAAAEVYSAVLAVQSTALAMMKPGAVFADIDKAVRLQLLGLLRDMGVVKSSGGSDEAALAAKVDRLFMPHGLGHFLGLDVHDVSDVGPVPKVLQPGYVVTCEPGLYFIPPLLDKAAVDERQAPFIDFDKARSLTGLGGVRIEDNVHITRECT